MILDAVDSDVDRRNLASTQKLGDLHCAALPTEIFNLLPSCLHQGPKCISEGTDAVASRSKLRQQPYSKQPCYFP